MHNYYYIKWNLIFYYFLKENILNVIILNIRHSSPHPPHTHKQTISLQLNRMIALIIGLGKNNDVLIFVYILN